MMELKRIHTIPVYKGMGILESFFEIIQADGEPLEYEVEAWSNVGVFENSQGDTITAVIVNENEVCFD